MGLTIYATDGTAKFLLEHGVKAIKVAWRGSQIRQGATRFGCSIITNMEKMVAYAQAITRHPDFIKDHVPRPLPQYK